MQPAKVCCFIGHRTINNKEFIYEKVSEVIENLISNLNVRVFLFGSRSEFDFLCHAIVTEKQKIYPDIVRINFHCKNEHIVNKEEKQRVEQYFLKTLNKQVSLVDFEEGKISNRVFNAGKASYVERNQEMIDSSDFCVFYYKKNFKPPNSKSGTNVAYQYAVRKNKTIINVAIK